MDKWRRKQSPYIYCLQKTHFRFIDIHRLKVKGWKNLFNENGNFFKAVAAMHIQVKTDVKTKPIMREKEGPKNSTSGYLSEETQNANSERYMHPHVHWNIIYNSQDMGNSQSVHQ